jgi:uncharacterized membrane protein YeaQ/YmgE (transglycosylase-associated protein family)
MDTIWLIITTLVGGTIIGVLGRMVAPGDRDKIPFWLTVACGVVGMLVGSYLYWVLFGENNKSFDRHEAEPTNATNGIDWIRHLWQVATAAVAVMAAAALTGRGKGA